MPATATEPCILPVLPASPTVADLQDLYVARGAALVACDAARALAVDLHQAEHADVDAWLRDAALATPRGWRR